MLANAYGGRNGSQPLLFHPPPIARPGDPATSQQAAADLDASGARGRMMRVALDLLRRNPGCTAAELEAVSGLIDGRVRKRLNDLRHAGLARVSAARRCSVTGKRAQTWEAA